MFVSWLHLRVLSILYQPLVFQVHLKAAAPPPGPPATFDRCSLPKVCGSQEFSKNLGKEWEYHGNHGKECWKFMEIQLCMCFFALWYLCACCHVALTFNRGAGCNTCWTTRRFPLRAPKLCAPWHLWPTKMSTRWSWAQLATDLLVTL